MLKTIYSLHDFFVSNQFIFIVIMFGLLLVIIGNAVLRDARQERKSLKKDIFKIDSYDYHKQAEVNKKSGL